jgi:cell division protein FtsI (penicillin-binding protein 3)
MTPERDRRIILALTGLVLTAMTGLGARLYWVQVVANPHYDSLRQSQLSGRIDRTHSRRDIYASSGELVATSEPVESIAVAPDEIRSPETAAPLLAAALGLPIESVYEALTARTADGRPRRFAWLKRRIPPGEAEAVRALKLRGVIFEREFRRRYPQGRLLAHVLGTVDIDEVGREGIELVAEPFIGALRNSSFVTRDARRLVVERRDEGVERPLRGNLYLTIDLEFQRIVDEEMRRGWEQFRAKWACAIAMDPRTGEVLALCVIPDFDANEYSAAPPDIRRNRVLTDPYEPGSVLKPLVVAGALERGLVTCDESFDCGHGSFRFGGRTVRDHKPFGTLTVSQIIAQSSNVGTCKIAQRLGREGVRQSLAAFGLGRKTSIDLPAESPGQLKPAAQWSDYTLTSAPIGYELLVTPIQLACAFSAIANGGLRVRPRVAAEVLTEDGFLVERPAAEPPRRAISAETAAKVRAILEEVVLSGTGAEAAPKGMRVAGKTGTTQVLDRSTGTYQRDRHIASFVGYAPAENPQVCMAVVFFEPHGSYGGKVSAPVFRRILERGAPLLQDRARRIRERHRVIKIDDLEGSR